MKIRLLKPFSKEEGSTKPDTSLPEDTPRGMDFLYSLNRLNVATSRARCVVILVASPKLFDVSCRSVEQIRLANAFCKYVESANRPRS